MLAQYGVPLEPSLFRPFERSLVRDHKKRENYMRDRETVMRDRKKKNDALSRKYDARSQKYDARTPYNFRKKLPVRGP
jgi:hypothetical protein